MPGSTNGKNPGRMRISRLSFLNKAFKNELDFNPIQLNNWIKAHTNSERLYDLDPIKIKLASDASTNEEITINMYDYLKQPRKENKWLVENWISEGDICCIHGKPGSFKSTMIAHMCYAISMGDLVFNKYITQQNKVLYLNAENHHNIMIPLMERIVKGMNFEEIKEKIDKLKENLFITKKKSILSLENPNDVNKIINLAKQTSANVIVFDSFRRFFIGKENDSDVINKLYLNLERIRDACGNATLLLIHHDKKDSQETTDFRDMARGSGDIIGMSDSSINLRRKSGQNSIILNQAKNRGGEEMINKKIMIDKKEDGGFYLWETKDVQEKNVKKSLIDIAIEEILKISEIEHLKEFTWIELNRIKETCKISHDTIVKALRVMKTDGTIMQNGNTNKVIYSFI